MRRRATPRRRVSLRIVYHRLLRAYGPQHWWPARTSFEMMTGAILTQATSWHNVEQAIRRLRKARALSADGVLRLAPKRLEWCLHPSGYFRQKARRLRGFARWYVARFGGRAARMFRQPMLQLRVLLLQQHGIGPETADSILLYAGQQPIFVVDTYTTRVFRRHRLVRGSLTYEAVQQAAMRQLPRRAQWYNEFHALLVAVGKQYCHRRDPDCSGCPLGDLPRTIERTADGYR